MSLNVNLLRPLIRSCRLSPPTSYSIDRSSSFLSSLSSRRFASTKRYTKDHEWVSLDSKTNIGTIGITDYAQNSLGDVVFVELPEVSAVVSSGQLIGAVESVKAASDIFAPVSGKITEVNTKLSDQVGQFINRRIIQSSCRRRRSLIRFHQAMAMFSCF